MKLRTQKNHNITVEGKNVKFGRKNGDWVFLMDLNECVRECAIWVC